MWAPIRVMGRKRQLPAASMAEVQDVFIFVWKKYAPSDENDRRW